MAADGVGTKTDLRELATRADPTLKVSGESKPQSVARAIGHVLRESGGTLPSIKATGPQAINQAVKACAIARKLAGVDGLGDFELAPVFEKSIREGGSNITLQLTKAAKARETEGDSELSAKQGTDAFKLAGAIAGRVREAQQVSLYVKGAVPVLIAVKAIAAAQEYLSDAGVTLKFQPALVERENPELRGSPASTFMHIAIVASGVPAGGLPAPPPRAEAE